MNKKVLLSLVLLTLVTFPVFAFAQPGSVGGDTPGTIGSIDGIIDSLGEILWTVFGAIALIMFVIAGIMFLTAQGDPEKVKSARNAFLWGVVGIVVAIIAYSIVTIVENAIT